MKSINSDINLNLEQITNLTVDHLEKLFNIYVWYLYRKDDNKKIKFDLHSRVNCSIQITYKFDLK